MKEDKRVTKSKRDLKNALLTLLEDDTKSFSKISVSEICQLANINKMTFYNHYTDKYELFKDLVSSIVRDVYNKGVGIEPEIAFSSDPIKHCINIINEALEMSIKYERILFKIAQDNTSLYHYIFKDAILTSVSGLMMRISKVLKPKYPLKFLSHFISSGIQEWFYLYLIDTTFTKERLIEDYTRFFTEMFEYNILFEKEESK